MTANEFPLLRYDTSGTVGDGLSLNAADFDAIYPHLETCRRELLTTDLELYHGNPEAIPSEKVPLDAGFLELPQKILAEYRENRDASELGRILATGIEVSKAIDTLSGSLDEYLKDSVLRITLKNLGW